MKLIDILLLLLIACAVFFALRAMRKHRRCGKGCGCGCSSCSGCDRKS